MQERPLDHHDPHHRGADIDAIVIVLIAKDAPLVKLPGFKSKPIEPHAILRGQANHVAGPGMVWIAEPRGPRSAHAHSPAAGILRASTLFPATLTGPLMATQSGEPSLVRKDGRSTAPTRRDACRECQHINSKIAAQAKTAPNGYGHLIPPPNRLWWDKKQDMYGNPQATFSNRREYSRFSIAKFP